MESLQDSKLTITHKQIRDRSSKGRSRCIPVREKLGTGSYSALGSGRADASALLPGAGVSITVVVIFPCVLS